MLPSSPNRQWRNRRTCETSKSDTQIGFSASFCHRSHHALDHDNQFPCVAREWHRHSFGSPASLLGRNWWCWSSLIDLPLPFVLNVPIRGPGRYLHFLSAWVLVLTGLFYVISGILTRHFYKHVLPDKSQLGWEAIRQIISDHLRLKRPKEEALTYNLLQRVTDVGGRGHSTEEEIHRSDRTLNFAVLDISSGILWRQTATGGTRESCAASRAWDRPGGQCKRNSCCRRRS
jgi:hypothetical protein